MAKAKERKGLGTGLDVLFGSDPLEDQQDGELLNLPISRIEPREEQPRERFDEQALQDLADSISQYGLIQPIVVRKGEGSYYQIIAGERRWRAARLAGLDEVPVRVLDVDDRRTAELALVENLLREDLNPIEEAKGYRSLMEDYGLTQEETARSVGRSRPAIANALRLLSLSPAVMESVEKGELSAGHARTLLPLSADRQQEAAAQVMERGLSVRATEQLVKRLLRPVREAPRQDPLSVDYAAEVSDELSRLWGRKVHLSDGRKTGKIELEFYGAEDREALIEALKKMGQAAHVAPARES